jgi:NAD/NADP transhydrogenase alpha subunit
MKPRTPGGAQCEKITAFALELLPRISRAQSMDALSSQGSCAGYQCGLIAAARCTKFFPMLTTAAGTIRPARVLVIGAGVAGLQAIATCKRLGAMVEAYDVRAAAKEQIESLGAKFVDTGVFGRRRRRLRPRTDRRGEGRAGRETGQGRRHGRRRHHHRGDSRQEGAGDHHQRHGRRA